LLQPGTSLAKSSVANSSLSSSSSSELVRITTLKTPKNKSECIPFSVASHFEPTTGYKQSPKLPQWTKDYFDWHREQTLTINTCNFMDFKYLIMRCSNKEEKCGGLGDRLRSIPFFIAAAARSKRILLIRWERPTKLEEFLVPNEINWSLPDWMYGQFTNFDHPEVLQMKGGKRAVIEIFENRTVTECTLRDDGSNLYHQLDIEIRGKEIDEELVKKDREALGRQKYKTIFRDLFYSVFKASPPVAKLVREKMLSGGLVSGNFSACHYRAFYGLVANRKHEKTEEELSKHARNGLNCASSVQSGDPIYFASDSQFALRVASNMSKTTDRNIVIPDDKIEALHLDKEDQWKSGNVADFFPTFVDLLIMGEAKCTSLGVGGFGLFANYLSIDPSCRIRHESDRGKMEICH